MKFLVWNPDNETRADARVIEAVDPRSAAQEFVERKWTSDDGESVDVKVLVPGAPKARLYTVDVDFDPTFTAMLVGRADAEDNEADEEREARLLAKEVSHGRAG